MKDTDNLFSPLAIGATTVAIRIARAPMTRVSAPGGVPGDDVVKPYRNRAAATLDAESVSLLQ